MVPLVSFELLGETLGVVIVESDESQGRIGEVTARGGFADSAPCFVSAAERFGGYETSYEASGSYYKYFLWHI